MGLYLEDFYVQSKYRKEGISKRLLTDVCRFAIANGCDQVRLSVLGHNESSKSFYEQFGYKTTTLSDGWQMGRLDTEAMHKLAASPELPALDLNWS